MSDVGLLRRMSLLDPIALRDGNRLFTEFKGALTENYVLQSLLLQFEQPPYYWTSGNQAEVDFLIRFRNEIFPVEVKADTNVTGKKPYFLRKAICPKMQYTLLAKKLKA